MNETKRFRTDFLFPNSSFLIGLGSIINVSGNYYFYNVSENEKEADIRAIESDCNLVKQDMFDIIEEYPPNSVELVSSNE
jgi:hypothetical protein